METLQNILPWLADTLLKTAGAFAVGYLLTAGLDRMAKRMAERKLQQQA